MRNDRMRFFAWSIAVGLFVSAAELAAQGTYAHRYQFLPEESSLAVSGGFGGVQLEYGIRGSFGLVVHQDPTGPVTFGFTQVRAQLVGDPLFDGQSLDGLIGMSNWTGTLSNSYMIDFDGIDGQGAPMDVTGILGNVMLWLDGANRPPCCDFFDYQLAAKAQYVAPIRFQTNATLNSFGREAPMHAPTPSQVPEPVTTFLVIITLLAFRYRR